MFLKAKSKNLLPTKLYLSLEVTGPCPCAVHPSYCSRMWRHMSLTFSLLSLQWGAGWATLPGHRLRRARAEGQQVQGQVDPWGGEWPWGAITAGVMAVCVCVRCPGRCNEEEKLMKEVGGPLILPVTSSHSILGDSILRTPVGRSTCVSQTSGPAITVVSLRSWCILHHHEQWLCFLSFNCYEV